MTTHSHPAPVTAGGWAPGRIALAGYPLLAGALAATGALTRNPWYYGAALLLTLPAGLVAMVGVYAGYALLQAIGGLFWATADPAGNRAGWLSISSGVLNVLLLAAGAIANVLLLRLILRHRQRSRQRPLSWT